MSTKHLKNEKGYEKIQENSLFSCECGNNYKHSSGLWRHKKICKESNIINENTIIDTSLNEIKVLTNLVSELVKNNTELQKQNKDFQKQMIEVCEKIQPTIINNTNNNSHNNSHNKTFNLQVFLNEECKDAMNMSEFINSIQVKLSDLENIGNQGYIEGVSNIIINHLNNTDLYKRPVHCCDAKR